MKRKSILSLFLLIGLSVSLMTACFFFVGCGDAKAEEEVDGVLYVYNENSGEYAVKEYRGEAAEVSVESSVNGKPVTSIAERAFNSYDITSVKIPSSVVTIEEGAFRGCSNLANIELPFIGESGDATGDKALLGYIFGQKSFANSYSSKQYYTDNQFAMYYIPLSLKSISIESTDVSAGAVSGVKTIESFKMPNITSIGDRAFKGCTALKSINIESGVTSIGESAFEDCPALALVFIKSAAIAGGIESAGSMGSLCKNASSIFINSTITGIGSFFDEGFKRIENRVVDNVTYTLFGYQKTYRFELENAKIDGAGIPSTEFPDASGGMMVGGMNQSVDSSVEVTINAIIEEEVEIFFCMGGHANFLFKDMFKTELNGVVVEVNPEARYNGSGWNAWQRFSIGNFNLKEGVNTIKFTVIKNDANPLGQCGNLDYIDITAISALT